VAAFIVGTLIEPLPVLFHDPAGHFGRNGRNFLGYRLLKTFQSLVYLGFEVAREKKFSRGSNLATTAATRYHHATRQHAQETFLLEFQSKDEMCALLHHLVETTNFLLHVHRKDNSI
jgi:hypothetical protein